MPAFLAMLIRSATLPLLSVATTNFFLRSPTMGEGPCRLFARMLQPALGQQHLEGFLVQVVEAGPRQFATAHPAHLRLVEAAPIVGEARPIGLEAILLAELGQVLEEAATPVHHRAEYVEDADLEVREILGHEIDPPLAAVWRPRAHLGRVRAWPGSTTR
jgi:hypothetical protein